MSYAARLGQATTIVVILVAALWAFLKVLIERRRLRAARAHALALLAQQAIDELEGPKVVDLETLPVPALELLAGDVLETYRSTPPL